MNPVDNILGNKIKSRICPRCKSRNTITDISPSISSGENIETSFCNNCGFVENL